MNVALDNEMLVSLIELSRDEVVDEERTRMDWMNDLAILSNNDMNLHRVMVSSLTMAGQASITMPRGPIGEKLMGTIGRTMLCDDLFSAHIFKKLKKHAMYYTLFSNLPSEFPNKVVEKAMDLLRVPTQAALMNDIDLRFSNISNMVDILGKDTVELRRGNYVLSVTSEKNGGTPYKRVSLIYTHPNYPNTLGITKGVYSYDFLYQYLGGEIRENLNFTSTGGQVIELPDDMLSMLDQFSRELVEQFSNKIDLWSLLEAEVNTITAHLKDIVATCERKFTDETMTEAEKLRAVAHFIQQKFGWSRSYHALNVSGRKVVGIERENIQVSDDETALVLNTEMNTFMTIGQTYERTKMNLVFSHKEGSGIMNLLQGEDFNIRLFMYRALDIIEKDLRNVKDEALTISAMDKFGNVTGY